VECIDRTQATLYLDHRPTASDARELCRLARGLPFSVSVLRVQLPAADANDGMMDALHDIVRTWRQRGNVHLVFVGGFAASMQPAAGAATFPTADPEWSSPAHTAAFL
jgi:hypothetical protein